METKEKNKKKIIDAFKKAMGAKNAFSDMVTGKITKEEFESKGYKLAKLG